MTNRSSPSSGISRRNLLQGLSAAAGVGLAGCPSGNNTDGDGGGDGGGNGGGDLGEAVPTLIIEYWANVGKVGTKESMAEIIQNNLEERLGVDVQMTPVDFTNQVGNVSGDTRSHHITFWYNDPLPTRLDPTYMTDNFLIQNAGSGGVNMPNYASCEYTQSAVAQKQAADRDTRVGHVNSAMRTATHDAVGVPMANTLSFGAARNDSVDVSGVGTAGISIMNPNFYLKSEPVGDDRILADTFPVLVETRNFPLTPSGTVKPVWRQLIHSTLVEYDEEWNLVNGLAETYEVENDFQNVTVELKDATFHNGDPVTAEDVKFTFEHVEANSDIYPNAAGTPLDTVEVIDDQTAEFVMSAPFPPLIEKHWVQWGVFHQDTWVEGGAADDPENFDFDPIVGSGPFQVENFDIGNSLSLSPHDGNPVHDVSHGVTFQAFDNEQTRVQAFESGELDVVSDISPNSINRIQDNMGDEVETGTLQSFLPFALYPQMPQAPGKFEAFRKAIGAAINRRELNQVVFFGEADEPTHASFLLQSHPWFPENEDDVFHYVDTPEGDQEVARDYLREAGWGWDGSGSLHYPADADLTPLWPAEGQPNPDDYPCLNADGEFVAQ